MLVRKCIPVLLLMVAIAFATASAQRRHGPPPGQGRQSDRQDSQSNRSTPGQWGRGIQGPGNQNPGNPGQHGGDWLRKHSNMSPAEQLRALDKDPEFRKLPSDVQDRLRTRLQRFNSLPPDQQQRMLQRMDRWNRLTPEQRNRARGIFQQFRDLPQDRRAAMVQAFHTLRAFPPDQQQKMLDTPRFRNSFSDSERNIMRGMTELNLGPGHSGDGSGQENEPQQ